MRINHDIKREISLLDFLLFFTLSRVKYFWNSTKLNLYNIPCPMSHAAVPCRPSYVPCLTSLFLVSRSQSPVSRLCSLSPSSVPCLTWSVPCLPSSFLRTLSQLSQCPLFCGSIPQLLSFVPLLPSLCSSVSCLASLVFCTCENVLDVYEKIPRFDQCLSIRENLFSVFSADDEEIVYALALSVW